jgi:RNA polymerase sigma-70 factor (ECF subfamily)
MRDLTFSEIDQLSGADLVDEAFVMDEDAFRSFYDRTARSLWAYLSRATGDGRVADDLLQEAYYRFLRAGAPPNDDAHRQHYLFRIGVNLVRDHYRRKRLDRSTARERLEEPGPAGDAAGRAADRIDLRRAMARLSTRERDLLWLAYAQGSSHEEIAATLGLKISSIKSLLFRARRRLAGLLRPRGEGGRTGDQS